MRWKENTCKGQWKLKNRPNILKRGKTRASKSCLVLFLHLIGWERVAWRWRARWSKIKAIPENFWHDWKFLYWEEAFTLSVPLCLSPLRSINGYRPKQPGRVDESVKQHPIQQKWKYSWSIYFLETGISSGTNGYMHMSDITFFSLA